MGRPKKIQPTDKPTTEKPDFAPVSQNPAPPAAETAAKFVQVVPGPFVPNDQSKQTQIPVANSGPIDWSTAQSTTLSTTWNAAPPLRDHRGLYSNVEYVFTAEGLVDWKAMLFKKPEYLYVLKENEEKVEKKYGKNISQLNLAEVDEKFLCITLPGIRYLANLRGFTRVKNKIDAATYDPDYQTVVSCTATCEITWIPNFESGYVPVKTSDVAGANLRNCFGFTQKYLESMAANRAFVRAVRAFLGIAIVGKDEVGPQEKNPYESLLPVVNPNKSEDSAPAKLQPHELLEEKVNRLGINFDQFKSAVSKKYRDVIKSNPEEWTDFESIPRPDIFELTPIVIERIKEKEAKAVKKD